MSALIWPEIKPLAFTGLGKVGDFEWMSKQDDYKSYLFLNNDTVEDRCTSKMGVGSAKVRPLNKYGKHSKYPRSVGVPTFSRVSGPFVALNQKARNEILDAMMEMHLLIAKNKYTHIVFSASEDGTFAARAGCAVDREVLEYVTRMIRYYGAPHVSV